MNQNQYGFNNNHNNPNNGFGQNQPGNLNYMGNNPTANQGNPKMAYTDSRPLNTQVDSPEVLHVQKEQRNSIIFHLIGILLVFIASAVIHKYAVLVVLGAVIIWVSTAIGVYLMPNEERANIKKTKVWVIGYTSIAIAFDIIVNALSMNPAGYGLDAAALNFINIMRLMIFLGTPIMYGGITAKRIHFNWEVRNNEQKTASYMRQNTKKKF